MKNNIYMKKIHNYLIFYLPSTCLFHVRIKILFLLPYLAVCTVQLHLKKKAVTLFLLILEMRFALFSEDFKSFKQLKNSKNN